MTFLLEGEIPQMKPCAPVCQLQPLASENLCCHEAFSACWVTGALRGDAGLPTSPLHLPLFLGGFLTAVFWGGRKNFLFKIFQTAITWMTLIDQNVSKLFLFKRSQKRVVPTVFFVSCGVTKSPHALGNFDSAAKYFKIFPILLI